MMKQEIKEPERFLKAPIGGIFANLIEAINEDNAKEGTLAIQMINPEDNTGGYCFEITCRAIEPKLSLMERLNVFRW